MAPFVLRCLAQRGAARALACGLSASWRARNASAPPATSPPAAALPPPRQRASDEILGWSRLMAGSWGDSHRSSRPCALKHSPRARRERLATQRASRSKGRGALVRSGTLRAREIGDPMRRAQPREGRAPDWAGSNFETFQRFCISFETFSRLGARAAGRTRAGFGSIRSGGARAVFLHHIAACPCITRIFRIGVVAGLKV